jgi:hypothetical protein
MKAENTCFLVPTALRNEASLLLDQQLWLFGCDVRNQSGNVLLTIGFERTPPPEGWKAATQYHRCHLDGSCLKLWGFGFWYSSDSILGVFVRRGDFSPLLCRLINSIWRPEDLPPMRLPDSSHEISLVWRFLAVVCEWFADYEQFILQQYGLNYRRDCLRQWVKKTCAAAEQVPYHWRKVAHQCSLQSALAVDFLLPKRLFEPKVK